MRGLITIALGALCLSACTATSPDPPRPASTDSTSPAPAPAAPAAEPAASVGYHHHPIRTTNPEAQRLFDRGMAEAFGFNHEAAIRSFERASALDATAAMPHWGRAWALGPNYNLDIDDPRSKMAFEAIATAKSLSAQSPENERAYIEALATRYSADPK